MCKRHFYSFMNLLWDRLSLPATNAGSVHGGMGAPGEALGGCHLQARKVLGRACSPLRLGTAVSQGWPRLGHGHLLKPAAAYFSEVSVGWPCGIASPIELKAFLAD